MFTGIIENTAEVISIEKNGNNLTFYIKSSITHELKVDESVSHNGICLTVENIENDTYKISAVQETIIKTNISSWKPGDKINIERAMKMNGRLDGHIVQGHVDDVALCTHSKDLNGSWEFNFRFNPKFADLIIEKGSVSLNGVSLTAYNVTNSTFTVSIIPYTFLHTSFNTLKVNDIVNVEFDILGKYVKRMLSVNNRNN